VTLVFRLAITVLALFPNLLIGYVYLNKDAIIKEQKDALMKSIGGQLTSLLSVQTKDLTGNMDSMFFDKIKPEITSQHQSQLKVFPKQTGPAIPMR
jgi:hypothetical protein|tara:strand:+ start:1275 stop:1562 length:288 start_codon:yes stop_codon:yes gene_type:complete